MIGPSSDGLSYLLDDTGNNFTVSPGLLSPYTQGLMALGGDDLIMGSGNADLISGNQGNDQLLGNQQNDTLFGGQGSDLLAGQLGDDQLFGDQGKDTLYGGQGSDLLMGLGGNDVLSGDQGQDVLIGGDGKDLFILQPDPNVTTPEAADVITDFNSSLDRIGLSNVLNEVGLTLEAINNTDTLIRLEGSGEILGVVSNTLPNGLQTRFVNVDSVFTANLGTAQPLGTLDISNDITVSDGINPLIPTKVYRFSTLDIRKFELNLEGLTADADVRLIRDINTNQQLDPGEIIATSEEPFAQSEKIIVDRLQPGTYYVQVSRYQGSTNYTLNLSADLVSPMISISSANSFNQRFGFGLVDAGRAVAQALGNPAPIEVPDLGGTDWGRDLVKASEAWAQGITGRNVIVAVLDSGVDYTHPELSNNIWTNPGESGLDVNGVDKAFNGIDDDVNGFVDDIRGWDFYSRDNNPVDENGHGTHVSGLITATADGFGMTGVAPDATIMPLRILDQQGDGIVSNGVAAINYAVQNGADVINLSFGGRQFDPREQEAIRFAESQGVIVVASAGNRSSMIPDYPSQLANEVGVAVGSVQRNQQFSPFSNWAGTQIINYVVAPGGDGGIQDENDIYSTVPPSVKGFPYGYLAGTSMATAHVSGVVALLKQANPNLTPTQLKQILVDTANRSVLV